MQEHQQQKGGMIGSTTTGHSGELRINFLANSARDCCQPVAQVIIGIYKARASDFNYAASSIILIEDRLDFWEYFGMVCYKGTRAV